MKTTGRYSAHEEVERNPSEPFLNDLKKDIDVIDLHYNKKQGNEIKKNMIKLLLDNIN